MGAVERSCSFNREISKMLGLVAILAVAAVVAGEDVCYNQVETKCSEPGETWSSGGCNSVHGGFLGNSNNLHRIIVDDFTDSITYLLMASTFNTDKKNHMGFHKYFMGRSEKMWTRGKDMMKYVLQRGGKMGNGFQIPPIGAAVSLADLDYTNEMKSFGVSLDLLKSRAEEIRETAEKLNTLGRMVRKDNSRNMALHMFDQ